MLSYLFPSSYLPTWLLQYLTYHHVPPGAPVNMQDADGDTPLHLTLGTEVDNPGVRHTDNYHQRWESCLQVCPGTAIKKNAVWLLSVFFLVQILLCSLVGGCGRWGRGVISWSEELRSKLVEFFCETCCCSCKKYVNSVCPSQSDQTVCCWFVYMSGFLCQNKIKHSGRQLAHLLSEGQSNRL